MQTYTYQMTGIKDGKPISMFVTTTAHPTIVSKHPESQACNRAYRLFTEIIGNSPYTWIYVGDAERWFALMNDPYITPEDHEWLHMGDDAIRCWEYFSGAGEDNG